MKCGVSGTRRPVDLWYPLPRMARAPRPDTHAHSRHRVPTGDGWPITLHEYGDRGDPRVPVLLCHGSCSNHRIYDLGGGFGLAPHLSRDGRRVFCVDLRGRGDSFPSERTKALVLRGWTMDDLLLHDLPAAIAYVLGATGAEQLDYVGHSMGGLLILAHLSATGDARVRRVVSVGSSDFGSMEEARTDPSVRQVDLSKVLAPAFLTLPIVPVGPFARGLSRVQGLVPDALPNPGWNTANVEPEHMARYLREGLVSVSSRKFRVFRGLPERDALSRYHHPTFWLAGKKDGLIEPRVVKRCHDRAASREKRYQLYARSAGYRADYGHSDLLIGRYAPLEVFPEIEGFLEGA